MTDSKITLYHVSYGADNLDKHNSKIFAPRLPESAALDESKLIKRICLAESPLKCIQAIQITPPRNSIITLYKVRLNKFSNALIPPKVVRYRGLVVDALESKEWWYLDTLQMKAKYYRVSNIDMEFDLAWTVITPKNVLDTLNKLLIKYNKRLTSSEMSNILKRRSSNSMYYTAISIIDNKQWYDMEDDFWEELGMIHFGSLKRITKLELREVDKYGKIIENKKPLLYT